VKLLAAQSKTTTTCTLGDWRCQGTALQGESSRVELGLGLGLIEIRFDSPRSNPPTQRIECYNGGWNTVQNCTGENIVCS
jgi:hypothetical protein